MGKKIIFSNCRIVDLLELDSELREMGIALLMSVEKWYFTLTGELVHYLKVTEFFNIDVYYYVCSPLSQYFMVKGISRTFG